MSSTGAPGSSSFDVTLTERKWPQYPSIDPGEGLITVWLPAEDKSYDINIQGSDESFFNYWYTWFADQSAVQNDQLYAGVYGTFALGDGNDTLINAVGANVPVLAEAWQAYLLGGPGQDIISNGFDADSSAIIYGGSGSDTLSGSGSDDLIYGDEVDYWTTEWPGPSGFDYAPYDDSLDGADAIDGGAGNDTLAGGGQNDTITGDEGDDVLSSTWGDSQLLGGTGNDSLSVESGNNQLFGGDGADTLVGGSGNDFLFGGPRGTNFLDVLSGGGGADAFLLSYTPEANDGSGVWAQIVEKNVASLAGTGVKAALAAAFTEGTAAVAAGFLGPALGGLTTAFLNFLFSLTPTVTPEEDILVIRDFDPSQDVIILPVSQNADLSETAFSFNPDAAGDTATGIKFFNGDTTYAELTLSDDFLASVGLTQQDTDDITRILKFVLANPSPINATDGGFSSISNVAQYLPGGGFQAPGQALPSGVDIDLFGAIGALVYKSEPGPTPTNTFIVGTVYADVLTINPTILQLEQYVANAETMASTGAEIHGLGGDDVIYGGNGSDILRGGDGDDLIYSFRAGSESEDVSGGAGNDTIFGGGSYGSFDGGDGVDTFGVFYIPDESDGPRQVSRLVVDLPRGKAFEVAPGAPLPLLTSGAGYELSGFENVIGGPLNDWIRMTAGGTVEGGPGADFIDATAGSVTFSYASSGFLLDDPVRVQLFATDAVTSGGDAEGDVLDYAGAAPGGVIGSGGADTLGGEASSSFDFTFTGGGGADLFQILGIPSSGDVVYVITDFAHGDLIDLRLIGATEADVQFSAGEVQVSNPGGTDATVLILLDDSQYVPTAADMLFASAVSGIGRAAIGGGALAGGEGNDVLRGRPGENFLNGHGGDDTAVGDGGADMLDGGSGRDMLRGNGGDDRLSGGGDADQLFGGDGADVLLGGAGNDSIWGGDGNDRVLAGAGDDLVRGGPGDNTLRGEGGDDLVFAGEGNDLIQGGDGADTLSGAGGHDLISGGAGGDILLGGAGDDTIEGGAGGDIMRGGLGADLFRLVFGSAAGDSILDFNAAEGDRLAVEADKALAVAHLGGRLFAITDGAVTEILQVKGATLADFDLLIG